jgi:hypothetical protein
VTINARALLPPSLATFFANPAIEAQLKLRWQRDPTAVSSGWRAAYRA